MSGECGEQWGAHTRLKTTSLFMLPSSQAVEQSLLCAHIQGVLQGLYESKVTCECLVHYFSVCHICFTIDYVLMFIFSTCQLVNVPSFKRANVRLFGKQTVQCFNMGSLSHSKVHLPIQDWLSAAVQVVKLLLGHRVVYIHSRHTQLSSFRQLVQPRSREE